MSTRVCDRCGETCHGCDNQDDPHFCPTCKAARDEEMAKKETVSDETKALRWIAEHCGAKTGLGDVAHAALVGNDVDKAIQKAQAQIERDLRPPGPPATLDGGYSNMGFGWGDGRGR